MDTSMTNNVSTGSTNYSNPGVPQTGGVASPVNGTVNSQRPVSTPGTPTVAPQTVDGVPIVIVNPTVPVQPAATTVAPSTNVSANTTNPSTTWIKATDPAVAYAATPQNWKEDPRIIAMLGWVVAPIPLFLIKRFLNMKNDEFVKYHSRQSFIFGVVNLILAIPLVYLFSPGLGWVIGGVFWLILMVMLVARFYYAYLAYQHERPVVPFVGFFGKWIK